MAATMQQIADLAGVSRGTVDRAINARGRVNPEVEERILKIAREIGYQPKHAKSTAVLRGKKRIGIITQMEGSSFMKNVHRGIEDAGKILEKMNMELIVREINGMDPEAELKLIEEMKNESIDALAIMPAVDNRVREGLTDLRDLNIPVITFNADLPGCGRMSFVGLDNRASGRTAAGLMDMMLKNGGKVIAITGYFSNPVSSERIEGFTDELRKLDSKIELIGVQSSFDQKEEVEKIVLSSLQMFPKLKGIFLSSGGQAGIRSAIDKVNPEDKPLVIVYDVTKTNIELLDEGYVDFIIDQDAYSQGYQTVRLLSEYLSSGEVPEELNYTDIGIKTRYNISEREREAVNE